jgi:CRP-like cAMP-binding protein
MTCLTPQMPANPREFRRHQHLVRAQQPCDTVFRIEDGWACRYTLLGSARRQITALYLPGEYCEPQWLFERYSREPVVALTTLRTTPLAIRDGKPVTGRSSDIRKLIASMVKLLNRQSEWIASLGRKTAIERVSTVLLDIFERLQQSGRTSGEICPMPLTQSDLADVVGLTPVHVNRVLKDLRTRGLVDVQGKRMRIAGGDELRRIGLAGIAQRLPKAARPSSALTELGSDLSVGLCQTNVAAPGPR